MLDKVTDFPQYRKFSNDKVYYKIIDNRNFEEIQLMGTKVFIHKINAAQYPEMLRISEMLSLKLDGIIMSTEAEYLAQKKSV